MARYVDAEKAHDLFDEKFKETLELIRSGEKHLDNLAEGFTEAHQVLFSMPTADVEEVRHGEWIPLIQRKCWADTETVSTNVVGFYCSLCGAEEKFKYRYCHCGAKMDGKDEENDRN